MPPASSASATARARTRGRRLWPLMAIAALLAAPRLSMAQAQARAPIRTQAGAGSGGVNAGRWLDAPHVLLVSFDGFRHDYLNRGLTPNLERLAGRGARADALIPVFPTKTFSNHYSIATGLSPGHHGIVANDFYDPAFDASYRLRDRSAVGAGPQACPGSSPTCIASGRSCAAACARSCAGTSAIRS